MKIGVRHICLVGNLPKPYGGIATLCEMLTKGLRDRGIKVSFVDTSAHPNKNVPNGVEHVVIDRHWGRALVSLARRPLLSAICARHVIEHRGCLGRRGLLEVVSIAVAVARIGKESPFDLVYVPDCGRRALGARVAARWLRCPLVLTAHATEFTQPHREAPLHLSRTVAAAAHRLHTPSQFGQRTLRKHGVDRPVELIPYGVDVQRFRPGLETESLRRRFGLGRSDTVLLFVGDLHERKGPDIFVRSLAHISDASVRALLVGPDNGMRQRLKRLAKDLHQEGRVLLAGTVPDRVLPSVYNMADVLAFPTNAETEAFGLVAAEGMACGIPVVASSIGAIPEVVEDGVTGILVPPGDPARLGEALNRLLLDRSLARKMGAAGRSRAERLFDQSRMMQQMIELYDQSNIRQ